MSNEKLRYLIESLEKKGIKFSNDLRAEAGLWVVVGNDDESEKLINETLQRITNRVRPIMLSAAEYLWFKQALQETTNGE